MSHRAFNMSWMMQSCYQESIEIRQADRDTPETSACKVLRMFLGRPWLSNCRSLLPGLRLLCSSNPDRGSSNMSKMRAPMDTLLWIQQNFRSQRKLEAMVWVKGDLGNRSVKTQDKVLATCGRKTGSSHAPLLLPSERKMIYQVSCGLVELVTTAAVSRHDRLHRRVNKQS